MGKGYKFNPHSLEYEKKYSTFKHIWITLLKYALFSTALSFLLYFSYTTFWDTPSEKKLKDSIKELNQQTNLLKKKYETNKTLLHSLQKRDKEIYYNIFETYPPENNANYLTYSMLDSFSGNSIKSYLSLLDGSIISLTSSIDNVKQNFDSLLIIIKEDSKIKSIPSISPINIQSSDIIMGGYGYNMHPFYKVLKMHYGVDFSLEEGNSVFATADGVISSITNSLRGKGITITIDHKNGYKSSYSHLSKTLFSEGQKVSKGDIIALTGNTGLSLAPHLHYEVFLNGVTQNPIYFLFEEFNPIAFINLIAKTKYNTQSLD